LDIYSVFEYPAYLLLIWTINAKVLSAKAPNLNCLEIATLRSKKALSSLKSTIDKIKALEAEKKNLLTEIEGLKKLADAKATTLESEVGALRDEVKSLKTLIGQPESIPGPNPPTPQ
jgi:uncharacterized phage infection (PIP) family protein YhgE